MRERTPLVGTVGSFDEHIYSVLIDNHILPFMIGFHGGLASFVPQEDNCRRHRAKSVATHLGNEEVTSMKWLAQSPDLIRLEI